MKTIIDRQKVKKRSTIANIASVGGLLVLLASAVLPYFRPETSGIAYIPMIIGLFISMVGIYYANRWVRKPRPEVSLADALKTLNDSYRAYHYPSLLCDHILLTPSGVFALHIINLASVFSYTEGRWKESFTMGRALRYIVEERLGNPSQIAVDYAHYLEDKLANVLDGERLQVKPLVVFIHPGAVLDIQGTPEAPVIKVDKLRKIVSVKSKFLPTEVYEKIQSYLDQKTIQQTA
jgi:hypothetical protein